MVVEVNASGAVRAAWRGDVVVIVDVIDMSTSAEALLEQEPLAIYGAALDISRPPVAVNPYGIGWHAGKMAVDNQVEVVVVAEPRLGAAQRRENISQLLLGISAGGGDYSGPYPNIGAELGRQLHVAGKVVVIASDTGGVAWDAAYQCGAKDILTGTVARTLNKKGTMPAQAAANRALAARGNSKRGISVVAASHNSQEDLLATEYIVHLLHRQLAGGD